MLSKDYNTFKGLILDIIPELLTNKIVKSEYYLKCIFLKKKNTEPTPETTMWDFIYNLDKFILEGPFFVNYNDIKEDVRSDEDQSTLKRHYKLHIEERDNKISNPFPFFNIMIDEENHDPRDINFKTIPPIILNEDYTIYNGRHRSFLAKLTKNSINQTTIQIYLRLKVI